jgi:hypothetical protein
MNTFITSLSAVVISLFLACGSLTADTITLPDLPDTDMISIQLNPLNGAMDGIAGASVGWGFVVDWTSTDGDLISFTGSSIGSETNPDLLASYTDFIGLQGGPDLPDEVLSPGSSPWTETFDNVSQQGVGAYAITTNPTIAVPGAQDAGQITVDFQVYDIDLNQIGDSSYSYPAKFSVTVDAASAPEPASLLLVASGLLGLVVRRRRIR